MEVEIAFAQGAFSGSERDFISKHIAEAVERAIELLGLERPFTIEVHEGSEPLDSDSGWVAGYAMRRDLIMIEVPHKAVDKHIQCTIYHEVHHLARGHTYDVPVESLIDTIFGEGLAVAFEEAMLPNDSCIRDYSTLNLDLFLDRLRKEMWSTQEEEREKWFGRTWELGTYEPGYRVGKYLVDQILQRHPEHTPVTLARKGAQELVELSGVFS